MNKKISIIVPVFNCEQHLNRCLNSLFTQTYKNIEIILVNDGSTDNSRKICFDFIKLDKRVILIDQSNKGVSRARNEGLKIASGEFIQFIDSDDYLDSNMCQELIDAINQTNSDIAICGYKRISTKKIDLKNPSQKTISSKSDLEETFSFLYENALFNPPWNKLYRKNLITKTFNEDLSIGEDLIFNLDYFLNVKKAVLLNKCLYNYNVSSDKSLSSVYNDDLFGDQLFLRKSVVTFYHKKFGDKNKLPCIDNVFSKEIYYLLKKIVFDNNMSKKTKFYKIRKIIDFETIQKNCTLNSSDNQIRIINFLIQHKRISAIYLFFYLKKVVFKR